MNSLHISIIVIISITSLVILSTYVIFNPVARPHYADIVGYVRPNQTLSTKVSTIIIPKDSENQDSGKNYEPQYLVTVLGVNNTVRWTNEAIVPNTVVADNQDDPIFWQVTCCASNVFLHEGKSFNFTFAKPGEFGYHGEPHPWLKGWVLVLPQSAENAIQTVTLNASSGVPDACETFRIPCSLHPNNYNFTAQRFGSDIYIEKVTANGVDNYAIIKPDKTCFYPPTYTSSCTNPDDLAILRLVGADTSIPQENIHLAITGLAPYYLTGEPIDFGIAIKGYGHCDIPSVLVTHEGYVDWQSKTSWPSNTTPCLTGMHPLDLNYDIRYLGGPMYLNKSGTYLLHVGYSSNMTEKIINVIPNNNDTGISHLSAKVTNSNFTLNYNITGGKVLEMKQDTRSKAITVSIQTSGNGIFIVTLPRALLDAQMHNQDVQFIVLEDGQEVDYKEVHKTIQDRTLSIPFQNGTEKIEIIATSLI